MNEFELKYMLTKHQFRCLREFIENYFKYQFERTKQVNYYYDTEDQYYFKKDSTVRIREKNGILLGTVKMHSLDTPYQSEEIPFEIERVPLQLTYQGKALKFMGGLITYRYMIPITKETTLFLDENHYLGKVDYELEIEFGEDSFIEAWKTAVLMTTVLGRCYDPNQCFKPSISKSKRFFKRLWKNTGGA